MLSLGKLAASITLLNGVEAYAGSGAFFQSKTVIIPHDDKLHRGGEDAADSTDQVLTVADGVGGWINKGVNPGIFSAKLTRSLIAASEADPTLLPRDLVKIGCETASEVLGSATVVALKLAQDMII